MFNALLAAVIAVLPDRVPAAQRGFVSGILGVCLPIASVCATFLVQLFTGHLLVMFLAPCAIGGLFILVFAFLFADRRLDPAEQPLGRHGSSSSPSTSTHAAAPTSPGPSLSFRPADGLQLPQHLPDLLPAGATRHPRGGGTSAGLSRHPRPGSRHHHCCVYAALGTDRYPPFTLARTDYPATLDLPYPDNLPRGLPLLRSRLAALPQLVIFGLIAADLLPYPWTETTDWSAGLEPIGGYSVLNLLVVVAGTLLLITGRYPRTLFDLLLGINRWLYRTLTYLTLMSSAYPPFRPDQGPTEPVHNEAEPQSRRH